MVRCALFAALMAVCAWICVPLGDIAFTMQTQGLFLTLGILGGKWGTVSILSYLLLGAAGAPVFSGFQSGFGAILGPNGGFLWGFLVSCLVYWVLERLGRIPAAIAAMAVCYGCGCLWYSLYAGDIGILAAAAKTVVPYLIPDAVKLTMALSLSRRLRKHL